MGEVSDPNNVVFRSELAIVGIVLVVAGLIGVRKFVWHDLIVYTLDLCRFLSVFIFN